MEKFHNKAIFDAFNEALNAHRPYGLKGVPYLWRSQQNCKNQIVGESDIGKILKQAQERVVDWYGSACGFLGTSIEVPGQGIVTLNEEQLERYKEENLMKTISKEVTTIYLLDRDVSSCFIFNLDWRVGRQMGLLR